MTIANALNTSIYPCDDVNIYVSQLFGSDVTGTGSQFSPVATWGRAIVLAGIFGGTVFQFYCLDGATYDEQDLDFPNNSYIFAPNATLQSSAGDCLKITGFINITASIIQSLAGHAANITAGYPILNFGTSFIGDFYNNTGGNTVTINANGIFGNVTNIGTGITILNLDNAIGGTVDQGCSAPWSLALPPSGGTHLYTFDVSMTFADLAAGGLKTLIPSSGTEKFIIREMWINAGGTNFAGIGGNRSLKIISGATTYTTIPSASLITLANASWGTVVVMPYPAAIGVNTSTGPGTSLQAAYSGGTTDYTSGSVVISGLYERIV